jgi:hypothetical protein
MFRIDEIFIHMRPPEDEYSKHVEDIYWSKFKKKVHLIGSYYANLSRWKVPIMTKSAIKLLLLVQWYQKRDISLPSNLMGCARVSF